MIGLADAYTAGGGILILLTILVGGVLGLLAIFMPYFVYRIYLHTLDTSKKMDELIFETRLAKDEQRKTNSLLKQALEGR